MHRKVTARSWLRDTAALTVVALVAAAVGGLITGAFIAVVT